MKHLPALALVVALAIFCSCQKQQTDEERNAEVERQVQQRLAAEHQAQEQQQLAQREADLDAHEKALAEKETAAAKTQTRQTTKPSVPQVSGPPANRPTASYSTFYTNLEPYGVWRETSDYGYVWQPDAAQRSRDWRPYTDGRWVYTDVGWMWISEEPFGWAAYHYGRWTRLSHIGWVWVPGEEWAPAWVSWRKGDDYIGWAPLPPEARFDRRTGIRNWSDNYYDVGPDQYCFVATRQFGAQRVSPTIVPPERNVTIVNQTTNVTNITYNNTTVVNQGPDYYELRSRTQQPIEHLRVERRTAVNASEENSRSVVRGEVIEISAPVIAKPAPAERPRRVKETISQTTVDRGWHAVPDSQAAEKARAKIKSESTPPPDAPPRTFVKPIQASAGTDAPATASTSSPIAQPAEPHVAAAQAPDESDSDRSKARLGRRNGPSPTPTPDAAPSPTPTATAKSTSTPTPTPSPNVAVTPDSTPMPIPAVSPDSFQKPGFPQQGDKKKEDKKAEKEEKKEEKKHEKKHEKMREKKERAEPGESASPTPTPAAE